MVFPDRGPFNPEIIAIPQADMIAAWSRSAHADLSAEAFAHWNSEGEIPPQCAVCHSGAGFRALHGLDGSPVGMPEHPFPIGGVVDCETCHNPRLSEVKQITFPSGVSHPVVGVEAACMSCHQGRESGLSVVKATADMDEDTVNEKLRFINPHYRLAAATNLGDIAQVGYQYPGKDYSGRFLHAKPIGTCVSCHNPHSLEIAEEPCLTCHQTGNPDDIRIAHVSFDGSGDTSKGIKADIAANAAKLMETYLAYAANVAGTPMVFDGASYPYFFTDANLDGVADTDAQGKVVAYASWTPRLLKAVYNWKVVTADPGIHAHNPYYALELLYDSVEDLASADGMNVELGDMLR
ncbi:MAG: ammonia-forming cytochrome c nitrite reductase subunit c552 [Alphaproteobacteria bacterium]|nr:ammonia-forming cytochrome c nitrite reductase subunit c552 [Alphaproteobacteria bacterium]